MKGKLPLAFLLLALGGWFVPSPAAAITFRAAASTDVNGSSLTLTISVPTGTLQGDVMIAGIAVRPSTAVITAPAGWTLVRRQDNALSIDNSLAIYYKIAGASEPASYTWSFNTSTGSAGGIQSFSGVETTNPVNVEAGSSTTAATNSFPAPSVTTTAANTMVVTHHAYASSTRWFPPTGMTEAVTGASNAVNNTAGEAIEGNYLAQAGIATIGPFTATLNLTGIAAGKQSGYYDNGNMHTLVLNPACPAVADAGYVAATAQSGQATIYWLSPNPVVILQKTAPFTSESPTNYVVYTVGATVGAASVVYAGTTPQTSFAQTGLTNGTTYYYKVFVNAGGCYAPGTVNTAAGVVARPATGAGFPTWSYSLAGGSILKGGTAGTGTIYATSNASRIVGLNTADGTQSWAPVASNAAIQAWLTWLPVGSGGVKSVQTGTTTMPSTGAGVTQTINVGSLGCVTVAGATGCTSTAFNGVTNLTKSVVFFNLSEQSTTPGSGQVRGQLLDANTIQFNRANDDNQAPAAPEIPQSTVTIQWYVVEFKGGVFVQRGTLTPATNTSSVTLTTAVDPAKSFVLISCSVLTGDVTYDTNDYYRARLTSSTTLEITHGNAADVSSKSCDWQVVEYSGASVQRGIGSFLSTDLSSGAIAITPVDTTKSFVQVTWRATSAAATPQTGPNFLRAQLTGGGASVTIDRAVSGVTIDYAWEVVSFTDGTTVQSGNLSFGTADTSLTAPINVDPTRSVAFLSAYQRGGSQAYTGNDDVGPGWFTTTITNSTTLTVQRQNTQSVAANAAWFVVQFPQTGGSPVVIGVDLPLVADTARLYSVDPALGITNWPGSTMPTGWLATGLPGADQFQAAPAAQVRQWSSAAFQGAYTDDVIFASTLNTLGTFTTNNKVFALGASNGALLWTFSGTMDGIVGMPWVDYARDRIYVASRAGSGGTQQSLWVIKTVDGEGVLKGQAMSCPACTGLGHLETSPTLSFNGLTLYVGSTAGTLYAINAAGLTLKWSLALGTAIKGFVWEDYVTTGRLYFAAADGTVRCIQDNGTSGAPCAGWTSPTVPGPSAPLELGKLFVGSWDPAAVVGQKGKLYQINLTTGAVEKTVVVGDGEKQPGDVSSETGNEVFVGTTEGTIYKFPLTGGSL